jgi:hypothetical protein
MPDIRDQLDQVWNAIDRPSTNDGVLAQRVPNCRPTKPLYLGVGGDESRHILIPVPAGTPPVTQRSTRGMDVVTSIYTIGDRPEGQYIDLCCRSPTLFPTFSAFAEDLVRAVYDTTASARDAALSVLARWRAFWSSTASPLTHEELLGLFGELWFLHRWIGAQSPDSVESWNGPDGARYDFQWSAASVEVKTAQSGSTGGVVHRIAGLDQLDDPPRGTLYLFSLQVLPDTQSQNTLIALIEELRRSLGAASARILEFDRKLAQTGFSTVDPSIPELRLRVIAEHLYSVSEGFPRLTRRSFARDVPAGVNGIVYNLETSACGTWLIADRPDGFNERLPAAQRGPAAQPIRR